MLADSRTRERIAIAALVIVAVALPLFVKDYRTFQFSMIVHYAIALLGLNILTGYNGQISIGHGAFYAIGAYATAILINQFGVPYWVAIPIAGVICFAFGFLFGFPALRLEPVYLALATFSLAAATPQLLKHKSIAPWTGGAMGVTLPKPEVPFGLPVSQDQWLYYLTLIIAVVMFLLARNLLSSRVGRAMVAVRDHGVAAATIGINLPLLKTTTFGVSALYTGVSGALGAILVQYISPESFSFFLSITFFVGIVVGGVGTVMGAIYGAFFIFWVPDLASGISKAAPTAIYGACLIVAIFLLPTGIQGLFATAVRLIGRRPNTIRQSTQGGRP